ncbi:uncharacterized protein LOC120215094 [Hibiscus syriacus]|uniref:uncharacterized protein LOC120215094 n=1 Tax=Hibiscus syriacus TaxID=106335 RepID=UPI001924378A|nr:uncharacterized protein LOC120215094 [Hibiscus syriacus]
MESVRRSFGYPNGIEVVAAGRSGGMCFGWKTIGTKELGLRRTGKFENNNIRVRLDKGVANGTWWDLFPHFQLDHLSHLISDHCPLLLRTEALFNSHRPHWHFRFEASWLTEESCEQEVKRLWTASTEMFLEKLKAVSFGLETWFRKLQREKWITEKQLKERLDQLNEAQLTDEVLGEIIDVKMALNLEADCESIYWEQRARANWLKHGDRNTTFFHKVASCKRRRNMIMNLCDRDGNIQDEYDHMSRVDHD